MSTVISQNKDNIQTLMIENGAMVIDLRNNNVDIKTDGEKLSISFRKKEATLELPVQEQLKSLDAESNKLFVHGSK